MFMHLLVLLLCSIIPTNGMSLKKIDIRTSDEYKQLLMDMEMSTLEPNINSYVKNHDYKKLCNIHSYLKSNPNETHKLYAIDFVQAKNYIAPDITELRHAKRKQLLVLASLYACFIISYSIMKAKDHTSWNTEILIDDLFMFFAMLSPFVVFTRIKTTVEKTHDSLLSLEKLQLSLPKTTQEEQNSEHHTKKQMHEII